MAQPKPAEPPFPPAFTAYPPPPQGAYPYLPFPPPQEPADAAAAAPPQPAYMMFHPAQGMVYYPSPPAQRTPSRHVHSSH
ncbi:hypothetical protein C0993_001764 [Termitomyces sp. T159_Od127]|nr:hypothetical protein C0993_001764 [Termitomyces sp. T159_Od127]